MTYSINVEKEDTLISFFKGKELEVIKDKFSSIVLTIESIEFKENIILVFNNCSDIDFDSSLKVYDALTHKLIKLLKINGTRSINKNTYLVKDISHNTDFARNFTRKSIIGTPLSLCYKNTYNEIKYTNISGHDISEGGISFLINKDEVHDIIDYLSITSSDLKLNEQEIELKNMKLLKSDFLIGTKFTKEYKLENK